MPPLNGLAGFESNTVRDSGYTKTIFRLPLRTAASDLSDNTYNTQKVLQLLDALREEANCLLLFLKSVCKIEVIHISKHTKLNRLFGVEIPPASLASVSPKRESFKQQLKQVHAKQPYHITNIISFTATFSVVVTDNQLQPVSTNWLIANRVGSADSFVQESAAKQRTFPWVGAALELGDSPTKGRIFCFLPMPVETSSGLPVHVNGTFGLNDDRRTLKWPGIERKNDPTASWNKILVSQLLPPCYAMLLNEAKNHLLPEQFYKAWPDTNIVQHTQFSEILMPLFDILFGQAVVWTDTGEAPVDWQEEMGATGSWICVSDAHFIKEESNLPQIMKEIVLPGCGIKLVTVPSEIWQAIHYVNIIVTVLSPGIARSKLRSNPNSYLGIDQDGKREILRYCLSDGCYSDLNGLSLLPLADGTFAKFDARFGIQTVYLCSPDCPRYLLPNLNKLLVDLSDDFELHRMLLDVADSQQTRLTVLSENEIAKLLTQVVLLTWRKDNKVSMPHSQLPSNWLQRFWNWLENKCLNVFENQVLVPCYSTSSNSPEEFFLAPLSSSQSVVYISSNTPLSKGLLSALYKMNVQVCLQREFTFVQHRQISSHVKLLEDTNSVLDAIYSQSSYERATFTTEEADSLKAFLTSSNYTENNTRKAVLKNLCIFSSATNSQGLLFSVSSADKQSVSKQALGEPSNCNISLNNLPPDLIIFSKEDFGQLQLLRDLQILFPSDSELLVNHIIPLIQDGTFPDYDGLMTEVLDKFQVLNSTCNLKNSLQDLCFVLTEHGRSSPAALFDPLNVEITGLYNGEDVFPFGLYKTPERTQALISCGLQTSVTLQQVLNIIFSISSPASSRPQEIDSTRLNRAQAVLKYISSISQNDGLYNLPFIKGRFSFSSALRQLASKTNWLPLLSDRPLGYPYSLSWKGSGYTSHFITLNNSVAVLSSETADTLPHLVGSQMYLVSPTVSPLIAAMLSTNPTSITLNVVAHFKGILAHMNQLSAEEMDCIVHRVYQYMNVEGASCLNEFYSIKEWVYIKREKKFVATTAVALKQNSAFKRDLEPYIYVLPDSWSQYTSLFGQDSGVKQAVSQDQILSILSTIQKEVNAAPQRTTATEAWDMIMSILNWLTSNGNSDVDGSVDPYVPVETELGWPKLVKASEAVYTDNDFMKDYLQSSDEKEKYTFVHQSVSPRLAQALGVVPLTEFLDISEDTFEDAGQHEPLTTRLKNILRDYKDGLTIIKELLQNADDAEATEVNICYDSRQHETNIKKLFFSGMAEAHGPALIVHNNKTFSEDDFKNITKLAGTTKQGKKLKIGKFGVGFCSVYHMTDAPSFISRDKLYIFDPTLSYLKKEIKNPSQPGKKIVFTHKFISGSGQLSPYDGLFGFNRSEYSGTMFRLPFRKYASELSGTCYTKATVRELISAIKESSNNLLLFLQNVKTITFQQIATDQTIPEVLLKITKKIFNLPPHISLPLGSEIRKLSCASSSDDSSSCQWLVSQVNEVDSSNNYYTASVACPLRSTDYEIDTDLEGEIFCFLPLSQKTGLPVHVSSNFAVINNRRGIWTSDEATSQTDKEVAWNITLMNGVIPKAYHTLLLTLREMVRNGTLPEYNFHCLWPKEDDLLQHNPWEQMVHELYSLISNDELFYSATNKQWLHLTNSKFLKPGILSTDSTTPACVSNITQHLNVPVVDLPLKYHSYFNLKKVSVGEMEFIKLFFDNIDILDSIVLERNEAIKCMLQWYVLPNNTHQNQDSLGRYFKSYPSIPCCPDGRTLHKCEEIINPSSKFAGLFDEEESRFPIKLLTQQDLCLAALQKLGMIHDTVPWHMLTERAHTISHLYPTDQTKALNRVQLIITACTHTSKFEDDDSLNKYKSSLSEIPFLPVLSKPVGYPLTWRGDGQQLMCGKDLTMPVAKTSDNVSVSGSRVIFVKSNSIEEGGCGIISEESAQLLGIKFSPTVGEVVQHFSELVQLFSSQKPFENVVQKADHMCNKIYEFLNDSLEKSNSTAFVSDLRALPCIWTGEQFVTMPVVAREWTRNGPYLFEVPPRLSSCKRLSQALNIKKEFALSDISNALAQMKKDFGQNPIDRPSQEVFKKLVPLLENFKAGEKVLMLPEERFVLHPANELTFNDVLWLPKDNKHIYVHELITRQVAIKFKVKLVRSQFLEKFASSAQTHFHGLPFGQREELTRRIQNILEGYPLDITVLKELLQNADDAKASKMYIILDKRVHGCETVLSEDWKELQGPALLVWNDSVFSEEDLQGIQDLGLGSKRSDADTIGQYGIGFNVVYHLTDCPSFITGGETMCVLDPHCRYVPGAVSTNPGRRYDNLIKGSFWDIFKDMQSAYLQSGLDNCPAEIQKGGSLFRFPLRHTPELVKSSKIVQRDPSPKPLTAEDMQNYFKEWAPFMKEAMLFLNHVTELCFFVIEKNSNSLFTMNNYQVMIHQSAQERRANLHSALSAFKKESGSKSFLVHYPMTISTVIHKRNCEQVVEEEWLIQQGVGDIDNEQQTWKFINKIKPRHGIAAPIELPQPGVSGNSCAPTNAINGQVFCFLPLPVKSRLPVHINGHFILDSNRRELWHSTDPDKEDAKQAWNRKMFEAIASSYSLFLEYAQGFFTFRDQYVLYEDVFEALKRYYAMFPHASSDMLDGQYLTVAESVYEKLVTSNSTVLAVIFEVSRFSIRWLPIQSKSPSSQVYFWSVTSYDDGTPEYERRNIKPLLEAMGMQLTAAPSRIRSHLNRAMFNEKMKLLKINPSTVYSYYQQFSRQAAISGTFPCTVDCTIFKTAKVFKRFTNYLLQNSKQFPDDSPFGHPLLLTADNMLRMFDKNHKVLSSNYSHLFQKKLELFLHPELLGMYCKEYFAGVSDYYALIIDILRTELPLPLSNVSRVHNYVSYISKQRLKALWICFRKDRAFSSQQDTILEKWALIPTDTEYLYSSASDVLPVNFLEGVHDTIASKSLYRVLVALNMPFVNTALIDGTAPICPHLTSNNIEILKNLYSLSQEVKFSDLLTKEYIKIIFDSFHMVDFRNHKTSLQYIRSLPLFQNVDGTFSSIEGKTTYLWHDSVSTIGYEKWIRCFNVIFLDSSGAWTIIGTEQLDIRRIHAEEIYYQYIFKEFDAMSEVERYHHLKHIKSFLFATSKSNSQQVMANMDSALYSRACTFINKLETLACIGDDGETLRPVCDFCDHTCSIFKAFKRKYKFLPSFFTEIWDDQWREFFVQLNLRQTVTKEEFLSLCHLAADTHEDPEEASKVLLSFFLSTEVAQEGWYEDRQFIQQVANIKFVPVEQLPELSWIKSPYRSADPGRRVYKGEKMVELTRLSGTALPSHKECLWTIKAIVKLYFQYFSKGRKQTLSCMGVSLNVTVEHVLDNIKNISSISKFTDFKLFDNYPSSNKPPENAKTLTEVMKSQFKFLQDNLSALSQRDKDFLKNTPCIPVSATAEKSHTHSWKVVLVKPCVVINGDPQGFHPFLHSLPSDLTTYLGLLSSIGVCESTSIKHCQLVLESAYIFSEKQKLDLNSLPTVVKALKLLYSFLKTPADSSAVLAPLYLPSNQGTLALSTDLLYPDSSTYLGRIKDIQIQSYSLIRLVPMRDYGFSEKEFCDALPESVRPRGMSKVCCQKICEECKDPTSPCATHVQLEQTFAMKNELTSAIDAVVKHQAKESRNDLGPLIRDFVAGIRFVTVKKVQTVITLKETGEVIGKLDLAYYLQSEQFESTEREQLCVYMDSNKVGRLLIDGIIIALTDKLIKIVRQQNPDLDRLSLSEISKIIISLLQLQTPRELEQFLNDKSIGYKVDSTKMQDVTFELGKEVPADWHHRLDQSIDNVFHPGEIVGYEIQEDCIIFARIMHPVLPDGVSVDSVPPVNMRYRIYTSPEDDEGTEVGILWLYKFLRGLKSVRPINMAEKELVPFEGQTDPQEKNLEDILVALKKQLDEIWTLPEDEQKRAIRRLYLKWHPDKNPDNPDFAEKVFKFLKSEIDKHKSGEFHHEDLDEMASRHKRNFYREKRYYSRENYSYPTGSQRGSSRSESRASGYRSGSETESDSDSQSGGGFRSFGTANHHPFSDQNLHTKCNPDEAKRWLKQAEANFKSLTVLFDTAQQDSRVCGDVCFMAHQVAEKALKGGKYFVCGLDSNSLRSHNLSTHAYGLQAERPGDTHGLVAHTIPLENYYLSPRYPNRWPPGVLPSDQYDFETAEKAKEHAQGILYIIKNVMSR